MLVVALLSVPLSMFTVVRFSSRFAHFFTSLHSLYSYSIYSDLYSRPFSLKVRLDNIKLKNRLKKREMQLKAKVSVKRKC